MRKSLKRWRCKRALQRIDRGIELLSKEIEQLNKARIRCLLLLVQAKARRASKALRRSSARAESLMEAEVIPELEDLEKMRRVYREERDKLAQELQGDSVFLVE